MIFLQHLDNNRVVLHEFNVFKLIFTLFNSTYRLTFSHILLSELMKFTFKIGSNIISIKPAHFLSDKEF